MTTILFQDIKKASNSMIFLHMKTSYKYTTPDIQNSSSLFLNKNKK